MSEPTIFEQLQELQRSLLTRYAEAHNYALAWGEQFVFKTIKELPSRYKDFIFDPNQLKLSELKQLGFKPWDKSGLYLIPLWLRPFLKPGSMIKCIDGKVSAYSPEKTDSDNRFGLLAYGVVVYEKEDPRVDPLPCTSEEYAKAAERL